MRRFSRVLAFGVLAAAIGLPLGYLKAQAPAGLPGVGPGTSFSQTANYATTTIVTVANLPVCNANNLGLKAWVSDGTAPAFNTTLVGGGAVFVEAHCTYATATTFRWVGF